MIVFVFREIFELVYIIMVADMALMRTFPLQYMYAFSMYSIEKTK